MTEWQPVVSYEGRYEVSDDGRVRSLDCVVPNRYSGRPVKGRELKPWAKPPGGYLMVNLGHSDKRTIHRLVLEAFVGPCPIGQEALHANDIATDNRRENLRWGTRSENKIDAVRNGRHNHANKTHCKRGHDLAKAYIKANGGRQCRQCMRDAKAARVAA
jgi:hypothetical protein